MAMRHFLPQLLLIAMVCIVELWARSEGLEEQRDDKVSSYGEAFDDCRRRSSLSHPVPQTSKSLANRVTDADAELDSIAKDAEESAEDADEKIKAEGNAEKTLKDSQAKFDQANATLYKAEQDWLDAQNQSEVVQQKREKASQASGEAKRNKEYIDAKLATLVQKVAEANAAMAEKHRELVAAHEALLQADRKAHISHSVINQTVNKLKQHLLYISGFSQQAVAYADMALGKGEVKALDDLDIPDVPNVTTPNLTIDAEDLMNATGGGKPPCDELNITFNKTAMETLAKKVSDLTASENITVNDTNLSLQAPESLVEEEMYYDEGPSL